MFVHGTLLSWHPAFMAPCFHGTLLSCSHTAGLTHIAHLCPQLLVLDDGVVAVPPAEGGARGLYYLKVGAAALGGGALLALTGGPLGCLLACLVMACGLFCMKPQAGWP
jgi:hypothetical protein